MAAGARGRLRVRGQSLGHLRRQARDLLRAAQADDGAATARIRAVADALTLASAQLAAAREYGFASWTRLKDEVAARTASLAGQAEAFCPASIGDGTSRAARMLAATPELAACNFATAVILGDAGRVRTAIGRDPGLATRTDPRAGWTPLRCAVAGAANPLITSLLPGRGAVPAARDTTWDSTPIEWAAVGSGERPAGNPHSRLDRRRARPARGRCPRPGHHPVTR